MKTEIIDIKRIKGNESNPRSITEAKFDQLIDSILSFPKMLRLRPIVVDAEYISQGGNMRNKALSSILEMKSEEIKTRLEAQSSYNKKSPEDKKQLLDYWSKWQKKPVVEIVMADDLTPEELKEFVIKDNVGFGSWDYDMLANEWNESELLEWGMDVWETEQPEEEEEGKKTPKAKTVTCPNCGHEF